MKALFTKIIIPIIVLFTYYPSIGQDSYQVILIKEYVLKYSNNYTLSKKEVLIGKKLSSDFSVVKFRNKALKQVTILIFRGKELIAKNLRLGFIATIYQYVSAENALEKFNELAIVKQTHDESVLSKDWNYVVLQQNLIIRIQGNCSYSEDEWNSLRNIFIKATSKVMGGPGIDNISCRCGGYCY